MRNRGNLNKREAQDHQVYTMGPVDMLETTLGSSALGNSGKQTKTGLRMNQLCFLPVVLELPSPGRDKQTWKDPASSFFFSNHDENQIPENSLNSEVPFGNKPP